VECAEHELTLKKDECSKLEDEKENLKRQVEEGAKRREQMRKIEAMMPEFRRQIDEARTENEELHRLNEELHLEVEELKRQLAALQGGGGAGTPMTKEEQDRINQEAAAARAAVANEQTKSAVAAEGVKVELKKLNLQVGGWAALWLYLAKRIAREGGREGGRGGGVPCLDSTCCVCYNPADQVGCGRAREAQGSGGGAVRQGRC